MMTAVLGEMIVLFVVQADSETIGSKITSLLGLEKQSAIGSRVNFC